MNRLFSFCVILGILGFLLACGGSTSTTSSGWEKEYEKKLNEDFVGTDSGIVSFKIDVSLIYVEVDESVPRNEYQPMARAWALNFSQEK